MLIVPLDEMKKSQKAPEMDGFPTSKKSDTPLFTPNVTMNQILHASPHPGRAAPAFYMDAHSFNPESRHPVRQVNKTCWSHPDCAVQGTKWADTGGETLSGFKLHHRRPDGCGFPAETRERNTKRECCNCGRRAEPQNTNTRWQEKLHHGVSEWLCFGLVESLTWHKIKSFYVYLVMNTALRFKVMRRILNLLCHWEMMMIGSTSAPF